MAWKPCTYNGACANGFLVLADNLDMIVIKPSRTSGNMFFGGGGGVDFVTSASKSVRHLNCTVCTFMTWMHVVYMRLSVHNPS
jgi:hypothetical protein